MPAGSSSELRNRLVALWRIKLLLLIGLTLVFTVPYVYLAHNALFPARILPMTWIDQAAGFDPQWVWIYQSVYLLTASLPWLADERAHLKRYLIGFATLAAVSFAIFVFLPTRCPRSDLEHATGMYRLLLLYDGPYNAMPSLHVGFLFFTLCFVRRIQAPISRIFWWTLIVWSASIAWSTLAVKQHYAVDLVAGVALAWASDWAAWSNTFRISGRTSQSG